MAVFWRGLGSAGRTFSSAPPEPHASQCILLSPSLTASPSHTSTRPPQLPGYSSVLVVAQAHSLLTRVFDATDVVVKQGGSSMVEQRSGASIS